MAFVGDIQNEKIIMLSHSDFTIYSLWLILVPVLIISRSIMAIGSKLRGTDIANADRRNKKSITVVLTPLFVLVFLSVFTPIVSGPLFWGGCALIFLAGIIYALSIAAFVKAKRGLTTTGIYRFSRNPMYIAMFLTLVGFVLMAFSAAPIMGILTAIISLWIIATIHWMVLGEERFLESKHGEIYVKYKHRTPRYLLF